MRKRFHGLKRLKLRQTWNKYNLYNLARALPPRSQGRTMFQQKWTAKSLTRAYHGETVREKQWTRMFRRSVRSVVEMDHAYLAQHDGSEMAAGRGSGVDVPDEKEKKPIARTPYLNMIYAPTERRLDTAIFRALFASSTNQARQFVVHGFVKVNGKKMIYPGYQLNPGDMFQVEPDRVLLATGAPKDKAERQRGRRYKRRMAGTTSDPSDSEETAEQQTPPPTPSEPSPPTEPDPKETKANLQLLISKAKELLSNPIVSITAKRKQDLREFQRTVKKTLSRPNTLSTATLQDQLQEITSKMSTLPASTPTPSNQDVPTLSSPELQAQAATLSPDQMRTLRTALAEARENPVDASKPYATPWRPRDYMSPFAFVPRYLEVHQRVCAAVYIRHPVARPGLGEVPTPYGNETNSLAHNWYLRRR